MKNVLLALLLCAAPAAPMIMAEDGPGRTDDEAEAYNINEFKATAEPLGDYDGFSATGKATLSRRAWSQVQDLANEMARRDDVPDGAQFRITLRWRDADFVRVVVAHVTRGPWPIVEFSVVWGFGIGPIYFHDHCHYYPIFGVDPYVYYHDYFYYRGPLYYGSCHPHWYHQDWYFHNRRPDHDHHDGDHHSQQHYGQQHHGNQHQGANPGNQHHNGGNQHHGRPGRSPGNQQHNQQQHNAPQQHSQPHGNQSGHGNGGHNSNSSGHGNGGGHAGGHNGR